MTTLLEEFKSITAALNYANIEYAVCGGWAMAIHGAPRATMDIDLMIRYDDLERVLDIARENGYKIEGLPLNFEIEIRRISKLDQDSGQLITLDLLLATEEHRNILDGRQKVAWKEGETWVVSREGLIRMKRIAGRTQDIADIERLEELSDES